MRSLIYLTIAVAVMGLAFWAYGQNYRTQAAIKETRAIQNEIAALRERLSVLRAEWAYLNRPSRLRDLADLNYERLQLFPLAPDQFGRIDQVAYPEPALPALADVIDLRGMLEEEERR